MSAELVTTFMATLLAIGWIGLFAAAVQPKIRQLVVDGAVPIAASVAVLATLASLYLSGIAGYEPCRFCWWQRIFMYPLAIVLPIAAWRPSPARTDAQKFGLPLAVLGLAISFRHIWLQAFPDDGGTCGISAPCSAKLVEAYGFLTIPQMTALSFGLIIVVLAMALVRGVRSPS